MSVIGTLVISRPSGMERANGAVSVVHLYGPRGGVIGSTPIDQQDAEAAIKRLQTMLNDSKGV